MDQRTTAMVVGEAPNLSVILTIRLLMQGKEVGSIIGKKGDHIKVIRDESGAKINISDGSCPERIVTITGNLDTITKAFTMICRKFEDDMTQLPNSVPKPPITFRLIVPATQCGSLIGKGGTKIKEIREATGASIQVASEMLPNSTERAVTISGTANAIIQCMYQICHILLESPPKGATISYRPKPSINPLLLATSAAAAAAAQQPMLQPATALYGQLAASELTKIHQFNPLLQPLPGFNPTVLGTTAGTYSPSLIHLQASQPWQPSDMALNTACTLSNGLNGGYARTLDARTFNNAAAARDEAQKMNMAASIDNATNLSQYLISTSGGGGGGLMVTDPGAQSGVFNAAESYQISTSPTSSVNVNGTQQTSSSATLAPTMANQYFGNSHLLSAASAAGNLVQWMHMPLTPQYQQQSQMNNQNYQIQQNHQILFPFAAAANAGSALILQQNPTKLSSISPNDRIARRFCPY